jgi:hypothetical protein
MFFGKSNGNDDESSYDYDIDNTYQNQQKSQTITKSRNNFSTSDNALDRAKKYLSNSKPSLSKNRIVKEFDEDNISLSSEESYNDQSGDTSPLSPSLDQSSNNKKTSALPVTKSETNYPSRTNLKKSPSNHQLEMSFR